MIAISSHRPLADSMEYARNQLFAKDSWEEVFEQIVYFGEPQFGLDSPKTIFIESEEFPRISEMIAFAAEQSDWCCLINADIVVADYLIGIEHEMKRRKTLCATSYRWEFVMDDDEVKPKVRDNGLDFFAACPQVWRDAELCIPRDYRIGHSMWDTWMLGFFNHKYRRSCRDLTQAKVIYHPRHGGRRQIYRIPENIDGFPYRRHALMPA